MLSQKRRKKRQSHGLRTIELQRGKQGYGFTISGQQPCVLSAIIAGSPADDQGLKEGDHLITVNSLAVSQLSHEQVVRVIGSSSGTLKIQIAEVSRALVQHNDSDSSDEEYVKPRYTHRTRSRSNSKTAHLPSDLQVLKKSSGSTQHASSGSGPTFSLPPRDDPFPTIYNPMRPINGRASDFGVVRQNHHQEHRVGDYYRQGYNSRGQAVPGYGVPPPGQLLRSSSVPDVSTLDTQANGLSKILYPAMQPMAISSSSTINADDDQPSLRVIVGYIGSIEMPQDSNLPSARLQSIRSAVRRLRVEQKVHTLVLLEIRSDGIKLINPMGTTIVHYPVNRLAMSGMYPDDKRFFGLVTIQERETDEDPAESELSSSCHVFMVDPEFATHSVHSAKAKIFGIHCTIDPNTHRCIEFPKSCTPILRTAAKLYKDKHGGIFDVPRRNERPATSDSDTNSDSGLGFHKGQDEPMPTADRVYVVDIHIPDNVDISPAHSDDRVISPAGASGLLRSQTPVKSSPSSSREDPVLSSKRLHRNQFESTTLPPFMRSTQSAVHVDPRSSVGHSGRLPSNHVYDVKSVTAISPAAVTQSPLDPHTVEQLRSNMQRLLAMRKENIKDSQSLSDTESIMSDVRSRGSSGSRVSFNPHVAIATHNYQPSGAVGGRSSGSDSSSYIRKRDLPNPHSLHSNSEQSLRVRKQRHARPHYPDQTPKIKPPPPPIPPKPNLGAQGTQRTLDEIRQHQLFIQKQQQVMYQRQQRQQALHEAAIQSQTLDDRVGRLTQRVSLSPRLSDSLDSKLSPRAYPSNAPRPPRVATSERSAFQKISPESVGQSQLNFYNSNYNNNNGNDNSGVQPTRDNSNARDSSHPNQGRTYMSAPVRHGSRDASGRPIPAPRLSRASSQDKVLSQSRSCSVPPNTRAWWRVGRELNVDDGISVRSGSVQSLESQHRQSGRSLVVEGANCLNDKALSSESLVEVGSRNLDHSNTTSNKPPISNNNNVSRVASWAVSFENLLRDKEGLQAFTDYLKLEYSHENMKFWLICEKYKAVENDIERRQLAEHIFIKHIGNDAKEHVNIDSIATRKVHEQLSNPSTDTFDDAQNQVFRLMKTDSYARFIKSSFYQSYLVKEFENEKLLQKEKGRVSAVSSDASDTDTQKRRTFPNFLKDISRSLTSRGQYENGGTARKTWSRSSDDSSLDRVRPAGKSKKYDGSVSLTADLHTMKNRLDSGGSQDESTGDDKFLRAVLPDGSTSVLKAKESDTLRSVLATLVSKKTDLAINAIDVFPVDSERALDISQCLSLITCDVLRVEKRSIVRFELPNKRMVGVKAKPERTIRDVIKPILQKYGYNIDEVVITQNRGALNQGAEVQTVEGVKLTVVMKEQFQDFLSVLRKKSASLYKTRTSSNSASSRCILKKEWGISTRKTSNTQDLANGCDDLVDFEDASTQEMLAHETVSKKSKGTPLFGMLKNYSLDDGKGTSKRSRGKIVTFGPAKSMDDRFLSQSHTNEPLLDMITKVQSTRLDDQRGLSIDVGELPEFLKSGGSETDEGSMSPAPTRVNRDGALGLQQSANSAYYSDQTSTASSELATSVDNEDPRMLQHSDNQSYNTPAKLNSSYHTAIAGGDGHFHFNRTPDMNSTLLPGNRTLENTLTPSKHPLSPLPIDLPPPPQFGNEAMTSTPNNIGHSGAHSTSHTAVAPPPYSEAISRSSLASSFNTNNSNNNDISSHSHARRGLHSVNTIPGNNPGNRLSVAHHQPMIFIDEDRLANEDSDQSTPPSPTTHTLVLNPDEPMDESVQDFAASSTYNFYESQYKSISASRQPPAEPVKVTFV